MITESQFKTCARAFFPDCIFEKGKSSNYDYNIIKFNQGPFVIKFVDCSVIIQRGNCFTHYPFICCCEDTKDYWKKYRAYKKANVEYVEKTVKIKVD